MNELSHTDDFWVHLLFQDLQQAMDTELRRDVSCEVVHIDPNEKRIQLAIQHGISAVGRTDDLIDSVQRFLARSLHLLFAHRQLNLYVVRSELVDRNRDTTEAFEIRTSEEIAEVSFETQEVLGKFTLRLPPPYDQHIPSAVRTLRHVRSEEIEASGGERSGLELAEESRWDRKTAQRILNATRTVGWDGRYAVVRPDHATWYFWAFRLVMFHRTASLIRDGLIDQLNSGLVHTETIFGVVPAIYLRGVKRGSDYDSLLCDLQEGNLSFSEVLDTLIGR